MFVINEHNPVKPLSIVSEGTVEKSNKCGKMTVVTKGVVFVETTINE
jgi:hypothetical protein